MNNKLKKSLFNLIKSIIRWGEYNQIKKLIEDGTLNIGLYTYGEYNLKIKSYYGSEAKIKIGKFCSIAENVTIITGGIHPIDWISTFPLHERFLNPSKHKIGLPFTKGDIEIGNDVWLSAACTILSGVKIGNGAVVSAGAIVTKDIPAYAIVGGIPAKIIRYRFTEPQIIALQKIRWWDWDIKKISDNADIISSSNIKQFIEMELK